METELFINKILFERSCRTKNYWRLFRLFMVNISFIRLNFKCCCCSVSKSSSTLTWNPRFSSHPLIPSVRYERKANIRSSWCRKVDLFQLFNIKFDENKKKTISLISFLFSFISIFSNNTRQIFVFLSYLSFSMWDDGLPKTPRFGCLIAQRQKYFQNRRFVRFCSAWRKCSTKKFD